MAGANKEGFQIAWSSRPFYLGASKAEDKYDLQLEGGVILQVILSRTSGFEG